MSGGDPSNPLAVNPDGIPRELRAIDAWACWRYEADDSGRISKPPYQARYPDERAYASHPETWAPFDDAYYTYRSGRSRFGGISFAVHEHGIVGIDLDHVSEHLETAARICEQLGSYTEITPGRDGFRIFCFGWLPPGRRIREWIEFYSAKRFLTVTGQRIDRFPSTLQQRQLELEAAWSEFVSYVPA